jgi:hypothetical protein
MKLKASPRVLVDAETMERIWQWTELAKGEFSCLAVVSADLYVHGVQLFDQVNSSASTELDQGALAQFLCEHEAPEKVRAWIHSHGTLAVFWSDQDESCIAGLANESFLISIVVNKRHDLRCRIDVFQPLRMTIDEVPVEIRWPSKALQQECTDLFKKHVVEAAPPMQRLPTAWPIQPRKQDRQPPELQHRLNAWSNGWEDDDGCDWRTP